ncbi:helicase associated domain-containing protein [Arthrobacter sp. zg-Y1110]|uniref:helicase associated domain-containing protein n=1 Tax=Arthrobacter sp. zg-Y1110 TaxID=2886932 RepID=UPI001D14278C|nr:helicase associated domain-containing protein [Arthrobacter sp. zg-Y1110]MCC3292918.1 helicase associated domain-containing protein [Arthrobacter sp. zg-Y1110]UWX86857.1 helicase associated domain-containing protein [Arthrobacter sp. zg-Y1110]
MVGRAEQLLAFHSAVGRLPSARSGDIAELGLFMFLNATVRRRFQNGDLPPAVVEMLGRIPGALCPEPKAKSAATVRAESRRAAAFERWLVRAEIYTSRHGHRPTSEDENALYQWLNRARRKLMAGELEEPVAGRVRAVLDFPDVRTYRYRAAHGEPMPEEGRRRCFTGF